MANGYFGHLSFLIYATSFFYIWPLTKLFSCTGFFISLLSDVNFFNIIIAISTYFTILMKYFLAPILCYKCWCNRLVHNAVNSNSFLDLSCRGICFFLSPEKNQGKKLVLGWWSRKNAITPTLSNSLQFVWRLQNVVLFCYLYWVDWLDQKKRESCISLSEIDKSVVTRYFWRENTDSNCL